MGVRYVRVAPVTRPCDRSIGRGEVLDVTESASVPRPLTSRDGHAADLPCDSLAAHRALSVRSGTCHIRRRVRRPPALEEEHIMTSGRWRLLRRCRRAHAVGIRSALARAGHDQRTRDRAGQRAPLADARVLVIGTPLSARPRTTMESSRFATSPAGSAQLQVFRVGFQSLKKTVDA